MRSCVLRSCVLTDTPACNENPSILPSYSVPYSSSWAGIVRIISTLRPACGPIGYPIRDRCDQRIKLFARGSASNSASIIAPQGA
jgi:hypothetical protein